MGDQISPSYDAGRLFNPAGRRPASYVPRGSLYPVQPSAQVPLSRAPSLAPGVGGMTAADDFYWNNAEVTGGAAAPETRAGASRRMDPMAGLSLAAMLGGGLLDYYGQRQGIKSSQAEAERQAAEQDALSRQRHALLAEELRRFDPQSQQAFTTGALLRSQGATRPALAAGGKALGLSGSAVTSAGRGMLPMQRLAASQQGGRDAGRVQQERMRSLGVDMSAVDDQQQMLAALYPMRNQVAGQKGAGYRLAGGLLSGTGTAGLYHSMAQA